MHKCKEKMHAMLVLKKIQNTKKVFFKKFLIFLNFQKFEKLGMLHTTTLKRNLVPRFGEARKKDRFWIFGLVKWVGYHP